MRMQYLLSLGTAALTALLVLGIDYAVLAGPAESAEAAQPVANKSHTIPEDGAGDDGIPSSSHIVQTLLASRPTEDLVICIAGCRNAADRIVYSVPAPPKPPVTAAAEPAKAEPPASEASKAAMTEPAPVEVPAAKAAENALGSQQDLAPATAEASSPDQKSEGSKMEPTAAEPAGDEAKTQTEEPASGENSSESSDESSSSNASENSSSDDSNDDRKNDD